MDDLVANLFGVGVEVEQDPRGDALILTEEAKEFLLQEGTDVRYGARHLKRAIERHLVQPLSNLMATGQIHWGDSIRVSHSHHSPSLTFFRQVQTLDSLKVGRSRAAA